MNVDKFILHDYLIDGKEYNSAKSHCATVCQFHGGVLLAYYTSLRECHPSQRVYLVYFNGDEYSKPYKLEEQTGNPVLWTFKDQTVLLHSMFEMERERLIDKWGFCSNWTRKVDINGGIITVGDKSDIKLAIGYLGRCAPIVVNDELLLPIYFEKPAFGKILASKDGWNFENRGRIPASVRLMQPTLMYDGKILEALCRNNSRTQYAFHSESADNGRTWSIPALSHIPNHNNSIVAINDGHPNPLLIYNDARGRARLILSDYNLNEICVLNKRPYGAYPNYCFDAKGNLHIVLTDDFRIRHMVFSSDFVAAVEANK